MKRKGEAKGGRLKGVREGRVARYLPRAPWWGAIGLEDAGARFEEAGFADVSVVASAADASSATGSDSAASSAAGVASVSSEADASDFPGLYCCSIRIAEGSTETKSPGARRVLAFECYSVSQTIE